MRQWRIGIDVGGTSMKGAVVDLVAGGPHPMDGHTLAPRDPPPAGRGADAGLPSSTVVLRRSMLNMSS